MRPSRAQILRSSPVALVERALTVELGVRSWGNPQETRGPSCNSANASRSHLPVQRAAHGEAVESSLQAPRRGDRKGDREGDAQPVTCRRTPPQSATMGGGKGKGQGKYKGLWDAWARRWNVDEVSRRVTKLLRHGSRCCGASKSSRSNDG